MIGALYWLTDDGLHRVCDDLLVVERVAASFADQSGGDIQREEVLKLDISGAIKQSGR